MFTVYNYVPPPKPDKFPCRKKKKQSKNDDDDYDGL